MDGSSPAPLPVMSENSIEAHSWPFHSDRHRFGRCLPTIGFATISGWRPFSNLGRSSWPPLRVGSAATKTQSSSISGKRTASEATTRSQTTSADRRSASPACGSG